MAMRYPKEVDEWVRANAWGNTYTELAMMFNDTDIADMYGITFTPHKMHAFLTARKIKTGGHKKGKKQYSKKYPKELHEFIAANIKGRTSNELTRMIQDKYGPEYTLNSVRAFIKNHKMASGYDARFKKGLTPPNKGKKVIPTQRSRETQFKPGHVPVNKLPVGSEIIDTEGYHKTKVGDPNYWIYTHRLIWMHEYGDIPDKGIITFLDGDKDNLDLSNLELITCAENLEMHRSNLRTEDSAMTRCGLQIARLNILIRDKEKEHK